jgi:hypothetical protein
MAHPDYYLDKIQCKVLVLTGEEWPYTTLWNKLRLELRYLLQVCVHKAAQQDQEEVDAYFGTLNEFMVHPKQLVFVDGSQKDRNSLRRRRSWAAKDSGVFC